MERTFIQEVFAALVSSDWGGLADVEIEGGWDNQDADTITVRLHGKRYSITVEED